MDDRILIDPSILREAARHHAEAADHLRTVPGTHDAILESLDSLGPIFGELREAACALLEERRRCYEQQSDDHAEMAHNLRQSATMWEDHETAAAQQLSAVHDEDR